jgi:magnesium transporter
MVGNIFETSLSLNDTRMNEVMKKLAAWAAIIAVPTMITGWFGMNVPYWGFSEPRGVVLCACLIVVAVAGLFVAFRSRDWL